VRIIAIVNQKGVRQDFLGEGQSIEEVEAWFAPKKAK
jgi:hypothetical protein